MQDEALYECRLLLFEDPTLEAQPRHEVAVGVGQNELVTILSNPTLVSVVSACCCTSPSFVLGARFATPLMTFGLMCPPMCGPIYKKRLWLMMKGMMVRCVHFVA